jgi:hypothetical protein
MILGEKEKRLKGERKKQKTSSPFSLSTWSIGGVKIG